MAELTKNHKDALVALKTCRGQIDGIIKMIEEERYCIDISNQILSAQSQLARANKLVLLQHLRQCVVSSAGDERELQTKTDELDRIFDKLMK